MQHATGMDIALQLVITFGPVISTLIAALVAIMVARLHTKVDRVEKNVNGESVAMRNAVIGATIRATTAETKLESAEKTITDMEKKAS